MQFFSPAPPGPGEHYGAVAQRPWPSLLFILPMLMIFEIGTYLRQGRPERDSTQLVATYLIDALANCVGRSAFYLPGLFAIVILLTAHLAARHPWRFDIYVWPAMLGESLVWTLPLFVFDRVLVVHTALHRLQDASRSPLGGEVIRSFGAGIYEELVFRLICIAGLSILLVNVCKLPRAASAAFIVLLSAGLFAAQHHRPLGIEPFDATRFMFRTLAGLYLAGLFLYRGFGITCGCHAFYNLIVVTIKALSTLPGP